MYPMLKEDVYMRISKSKKSDKLHYLVVNGDDEEFEVSPKLYNALLEADGTKPLNLPDEGKRVIHKLKKDNIIRTSRIAHLSDPLFGLILFPVGNKIQEIRWLFRLINAALPVLSVSLFVIGLFFKLFENTNTSHTDDNLIFWLYIPIVYLSILFHELGHMNAGIASGYKVCSVGLLFFIIIPLGAYVSYNEKMNKNKTLTAKDKIQFYMSGIETNLLIGGILMIASVAANNYLTHTLTIAADVNIILAIFNLLPALGLDGEKALSILFDTEFICITALEWLFIKSRRKKLLQNGFVGIFCFTIFCFVFLSQIILILSLLYEAGCFIYLIFFLISLI